MSVITIKQLLEAGVHFGHHTRRWNPKMQEYIYTERNGIYIIDLQKTVKKFEEAYMYVRELSAENKSVLFVGTKRQAADAIKEAAARQKERADLERNYGGIKNMNELPAAIFVVDTKKEANAVKEAKKLGIPVIAIVDTNCDPDDADYIIPGNDDAIRAIKLISSVLADAVIEGRQGAESADVEADAAETAEAEKTAAEADAE